MRDKLNNLVLFDKATYDKLCKEVPNYKLITPAVVSERLKIRGSLARAALQELLSKGEHSEIEKKPESCLNWCLVFFACPAAFLQHQKCSRVWSCSSTAYRHFCTKKNVAILM